MRAVARHRRRAWLRRLGPAGRLLVGRMVLWHLACTLGFPIIFVLLFLFFDACCACSKLRGDHAFLSSVRLLS